MNTLLWISHPPNIATLWPLQRDDLMYLDHCFSAGWFITWIGSAGLRTVHGWLLWQQTALREQIASLPRCFTDDDWNPGDPLICFPICSCSKRDIAFIHPHNPWLSYLPPHPLFMCLQISFEWDHLLPLWEFHTPLCSAPLPPYCLLFFKFSCSCSCFGASDLLLREVLFTWVKEKQSGSLWFLYK